LFKYVFIFVLCVFAGVAVVNVSRYLYLFCVYFVNGNVFLLFLSTAKFVSQVNNMLSALVAAAAVAKTLHDNQL